MVNIGPGGAGGGIVGSLIDGSLKFTGNMYVKSGTMDVDLSNAGGSSGRLWIGGDPGATVALNGMNSYSYGDASRDHHRVCRGDRRRRNRRAGQQRRAGLRHDEHPRLRGHAGPGRPGRAVAQAGIYLLGTAAYLANSTGSAATGATIYLGHSGWG